VAYNVGEAPSAFVFVDEFALEVVLQVVSGEVRTAHIFNGLINYYALTKYHFFFAAAAYAAAAFCLFFAFILSNALTCFAGIFNSLSRSSVSPLI